MKWLPSPLSQSTVRPSTAPRSTSSDAGCDPQAASAFFLRYAFIAFAGPT